MIPNVLMLVGAVTWLVGETLGIVHNAKVHPKTGAPQTTSGWVWLLERKFSFGRMLVAAGLGALAVHFLIH